LLLVGALLVLPSAAWAGNGGSALTPTASTGSGSSGSTSSPSSGPTSSTTTSPGNVTVSATGNGITLVTNASAMLRKGLSFSGTASQSAAGQTIEIERLGHHGPDGVDDHLPPVDRVLVWTGSVRPSHRVRGAPALDHDRGREPDSEVRHEGRVLLPRSHDDRAGDRSRPIRQPR